MAYPFGRMLVRAGATMILASLMSAACGAGTAVRQDAPRVVIEPESTPAVTVTVELARTVREQQRGLMDRQHLDADHGMLFLYEAMAPRSFWMERTLIPLDMIFIDDSFRVVGVVHDAEPGTRTSQRVEGESRYVLEVNGGFARHHGISRGARVRFEHVGEP